MQTVKKVVILLYIRHVQDMSEYLLDYLRSESKIWNLLVTTDETNGVPIKIYFAMSCDICINANSRVADGVLH